MKLTAPKTKVTKIDAMPLFGKAQKSPNGGSLPALSADAQRNFFAPVAKSFKLAELPAVNQPERIGDVNTKVRDLPRTAVDKNKTPDETLKGQAEKLVSQTFYGTLMKQMHNSPFKTDLFGGGRGEEAFRPMYDSILADRMARSGADKLVQPIVKSLQKQASKAYDKQVKGAANVSANR